MKVVKSLILGSAASLLAFGAQAADLPVKAKAVEYVKVCSLYGAGFYYIPGTDTCLKIGGYARIDTAINSGIYGNPYIYAANGEDTRNRSMFNSRARIGFQMDTRTATEYGVLRTYANMQMQWTELGAGVGAGDGVAGGNFETDYAFIQFAGFTFGKAVSQFDPQWVLAIPATTSGHVGGSDTKTGILQAAYTATFGNGFSGTISAEQPRAYRNGGIITGASLGSQGWVTGNAAAGVNHAGTRMPDIVGNLRLDQAWGSFHVAAALHDVQLASNNYAPVAAGSKMGWATTVGFELKNLPTGVGDSFKADFTYAKGAVRYALGGTHNIGNASYLVGSSSELTSAFYSDGVVNAAGNSIDLSTSWAARAFYEHYWNPQWRTSLYGIYGRHENNNDRIRAAIATAGLVGGGNFSLWQIGSRTAWTPVKNLTFSADVHYTNLSADLSGTTAASTGLGIGARQYKSNAGTVSALFTALRSF